MSNAQDHPAHDTSTRASTIALAIPPKQIALFKAIIESYDNLATLRTEDPRLHHLKLYFAPETRADVEALLDALAADFSIIRLDAA
ncbi:MAG: DUF4911 domain-containing protein [Candidatus Binataceae bacterium]